jgi:hypothetical protein
MTTASVGTGTVTLGSAVSKYQSFADAGINDGDTFDYVIEDGTAWEIGVGVYSSTGPTVTRSLIESSTGALINLSGNAEIFITIAAQSILDENSQIRSGFLLMGG